jgi:hypothetical protein
MRPYTHIKLIDAPDVGDIQAQARKSSVGKLPEKGGDFKSYTADPPYSCSRSARPEEAGQEPPGPPGAPRQPPALNLIRTLSC